VPGKNNNSPPASYSLAASAVEAYIYAHFSHCQSLHPEDGGSMDLWNIGVLTQHYTQHHNLEEFIFKFTDCLPSGLN